jgi:hypothetical protein
MTEENLRRTSSALLRHTNGKAIEIVEDVKDVRRKVTERTPCPARYSNLLSTATEPTHAHYSQKLQFCPNCRNKYCRVIERR